MNSKDKKIDSVVWGGTVITMDASLSVISDSVITISDGKIQNVFSQKSFNPPTGVESIDARGCLVMPGLINGHTHAGMTLLRGIADDLPLYDWLQKHIFPLERKLGNQEFVSLGTKLACLEMIRSGTTLFNDMYYFEEATAKTADEMGIRAICGQTYVEISGVEKASEVFQKFDSFFKEIQKYKLVTGALAPHSIYGLSEKLWKEMVAYAGQNDLMIHTHLCETKEEVERIKTERGVTPIEWFDSIGLWEKRTVCAHSIELSSSDISFLGERNVGIVYNPESNLKLGNGICPVVELREAGAAVSFGTDGTASNNNLDLFREVDFGTKVQAFKYGVGKLPARESVKMLTIEGAKALHLDHLVGSLEAGKSADLIVMDISSPHAVPIYDWYSYLVYSASQGDVRDTMVAGKVLMKNRQMLHCDEKQILDEARRWGIQIKELNSKLQNPR
ncbi:MAG: amidohydrolase [Proteobacteria bacterium]|nr:amidohydrolase [Pseudomonadota bacterium]